ncbi:MAG: hypothetical protein PHV34_21300 [Verrucomicrobiae bacterium]|nr:hypothetical protein [Verrucomicrobiae bacterium]
MKNQKIAWWMALIEVYVERLEYSRPATLADGDCSEPPPDDPPPE